LNNPASAAQRAASSLVKELYSNRVNRFKLVNLCLTEKQLMGVHAWEQQMIDRQLPVSETVAAYITREEAVQLWLSNKGFEDPWEVASQLAEQGVSVADLEELHQLINVNESRVVLQFFSRSLRISKSVESMVTSTSRIFDLISAIKDYSFMDRAPILQVDVPAGLDATVQMLQWRLSNVQVERDYQPDLPCISAYGGELNQVWTALIENAVDALENNGKLRLACRTEGEMLLVEIWDSGPGIPPELKDRIFEPFFTTKPPGSGFGLADHAQAQRPSRRPLRARLHLLPGPPAAGAVAGLLTRLVRVE